MSTGVVSNVLIRRLMVLPVVLLLSLIPSVTQANEDIAKAIELFKVRRYDEARMFLESVLRVNNRNAEAHYYLGRTFFELCKYGEAAKHCKKATELKGDNADYYYWLGRSYGSQAVHGNLLKQAQLAPRIRKAFETTVKLNPKHVEGRFGLGNFYARAPALMGGSIDKAHAQVKALTTLTEVAGRLLFARILEKEGKPDLAEAEYKKIEEMVGYSHGGYRLYHEYGGFLLRQKRYDEAIEEFKKQVALAPTKARAHQNLGDAYRAAGNWQDSASAYREALQMNQKCEPVRKRLEKKLKKIEKALARSR